MTLLLKATPDDVRESQRLVFHDLALTMPEVAERLGISISAVYDRARKWGWAGRREIGSARRPGAPASVPAGEPPGPPPAASPRKASRPRGPMSDRDRAALASDMERFVADRIATLKRAALSGRDQDGERTAREIAHYSRSLTTLRGYRGALPRDDAGAPDGAPPRDLGELRDELRRHLERIWAEERARRVRGEPDAP